MGTTTKQSTTRVIGLIWPQGKREMVDISCLEDLYKRFKDLSGEYIADSLPYYLVFADRTIVPYVHHMFYGAFGLGRFTESELRELLEFSGI